MVSLSERERITDFGTDEEIRALWGEILPGASGALFEQCIAKALNWRDRCVDARDNPKYPRHPPIPHPCACHECNEDGGMVSEKPDWMIQ